MSSKDVFTKLGVEVKSEKQVKIELHQDSPREFKPPLIEVKNGTKEAAVKASLIPKAYMNAEFDSERVRQNIKDQRTGARKFEVVHFRDYVGTLNSIITDLRAGLLPECSYIIGAPNGFGKTSFVNTCIKIMYEQEMRCVPYISLIELAGIKKQAEKVLMKGLIVNRSGYEDNNSDEASFGINEDVKYRKQPELITGDYSWSEYINSDILFCFFASVESKEIESKMLKTLLEIRGAKGLPTIVFLSTSLDIYKNDKILREFIWDEILAYKEDRLCYDRVYHVSCYKRPKNYIDTGEVDNTDIQ